MATIERRVENLEADFNEYLKVLATKADLAELRNATRKDLAALRNATRKDLAALRNATKSDLAELRNALGGRLDGVETRLDGVETRLDEVLEILRRS